MPLPIYKQPNEGEEEMKKSWIRHEKLCSQLEACSLSLKQNEAQMDILTATGGELKEKHKKIRGQLETAKASSTDHKNELEELSKEIENVEKETRIWLNELHDVHDKRVEIDVCLCPKFIIVFWCCACKWNRFLQTPHSQHLSRTTDRNE